MTEQHLTPARARLIALLEDKRFSLAEASRRIGRNAAYLFQYVHRSTPRKLDEDTRQARPPTEFAFAPKCSQPT